MALILFDTNIFIDMLNGVHEATVELGNYGNPAISVITYMELRSGEVPRPKDKPILDAVLAEFTVLQLSPQIIEHAISIRGNSLITPPRIKLPDALIAATALSHQAALVSRNHKDFTGVPIVVHIPYDYDSITGTVSNLREPYSAPPNTGHPDIR
ncbi:PIN domain-containing protein [Massilia sp. YIM B04103]|uniref:PIN domain-containing protein n=1 Tax=Massilia sp. YIM B04103 TaxID=2963106 RepID=UPI002109510C|nr:PIN domain-containing protein [Massilia sp. YIM B04103]